VSLVHQNQPPATITTSATVPPTKPVANLNNLLREVMLVRGETDSRTRDGTPTLVNPIGTLEVLRPFAKTNHFKLCALLNTTSRKYNRPNSQYRFV
jgi:hypothetical protein